MTDSERLFYFITGTLSGIAMVCFVAILLERCV